MNDQTRIIHSLTREEQELLCFFRPVGYHTRLQQYLDYPEAFASETTLSKGGTSLSTTKTFRRCLRNFIRAFHPEMLPTNNALWLHLEKSGHFSVRLGKNGAPVIDLNASDNYAFQYLCFLHIRCFWNLLRERCRFPAAMLPVLVQDFSNQLNDIKNFYALLQRTVTESSQVIVL